MISPRLPAAALAVTFALAACTGKSSTGGPSPASPAGASPGSSSGSSSGSPAPSGLTPEAYQVTLDGAGKPVAAALGAIAKARTLRSIGQRIDRAKNAVDDAVGQLGGVQPPADIGPEHADYLAALRAMNGELDTLHVAVDGRSLCTSGAVLARLGKSGEFADLKEAGADLAGGGDYRGGLIGLKPPKERDRRPGNGTVLLSAVRGGRGSLTVKNGGSRDGVVSLVKGKKKAVSLYVRKKSTAKVPNIRDGSYRVYFTTGVDYDRAAHAFNRSCRFSRFDDALRYRTTYTATQVRWNNWTITLNKISGGNASTSDVNPDDFPS
ncbi:hypothetical protein [Planotetraspora sp. GP83]|uniref:hypothetical protein n=1 Tax=Planotetraspora sp. GP83 TaxID=3156264 RepID=UPI00351499E4